MTHPDKAALRRRYAALRDAIPAAERQAAEAAILSQLFSLPVWQTAPVICGYVSVRHEIDLTPVWEAALRAGKTYALPVTLTGAREGRMIFRAVRHTSDLTPARFGLSEPAEHCPTLTPADLDGGLVILPGLAFDDQGFRLGYGGGYYDRFLASLSQARVSVTAVGLVHTACRTEMLPHEPHDYPAHYIIDERRITLIHGSPQHTDHSIRK